MSKQKEATESLLSKIDTQIDKGHTQQDIAKALGEAAELVRHDDAKVVYAEGPLQKIPETILFEQIIKQMIKDSAEPNPQKRVLKVSGQSQPPEYTRLSVHIQDTRRPPIIHNPSDPGADINIHDLMKNVNLNHLSFSAEEIAHYTRLRLDQDVKRNTERQLEYNKDKDAFITKLKGEYEDAINTAIKSSDGDQYKALHTLELGEIMAIRTYSGNQYAKMNSALRGTLPTDNIQYGVSRDDSAQDFSTTLMDIAMASHGLNKLPDVDLPRVVRNQDTYGLEDMIKRAENHEVVQESAFLSTAHSSQTEFSGEVKILYKNVKGKSIAPPFRKSGRTRILSATINPNKVHRT